MSVKGIDVSHWQGNIDWTKVKNAGIEFAIIKAGGSDEGRYTDSKFEANYNAAKAAGVHIGSYYYVGGNCTTADEGKKDAEAFLNILKGKQFDYPCYIDFEHPGTTTRSGNTQATIAFCGTMENAGYYTGIYASRSSGFVSRLDDSLLTTYDHWVAEWGNKCNYKGEYGMWQYSSSGNVSGISGRVDMDIAYKDYPNIIINGGFNGYKKSNSQAQTTPSKTTEELAREVINGNWGNGAERKQRLTVAGYDYATVQKRVNELMNGTQSATYYTIKSGDTLTAIAKKYGTTIAKIKELNPSIIKDVNKIYAGDKIRVK